MRGFVAVLAAGLTLAACGGSPTENGAPSAGGPDGTEGADGSRG